MDRLAHCAHYAIILYNKCKQDKDRVPFHLCSHCRDLVLMTHHQIVVVIQMTQVTQVIRETTMRIMILVSHHQVSQTLIEWFE